MVSFSGIIYKFCETHNSSRKVRMAERSKALRSGRSPLLWAGVRISLLTKLFNSDYFLNIVVALSFRSNMTVDILSRKAPMIAVFN